MSWEIAVACRNRMIIYDALKKLVENEKSKKGQFLMEEDLIFLKNKIVDINKLLQLQSACNDSEYTKKLMDELDRLLYKYYKALVTKMRNMEGNGDGI